jgi:dTDP-4-dehydrorhamnose 3,5-epimerase
MEINHFHIEGLVEIVPKIFTDDRGFFLETHSQFLYEKILGPTTFVQDNQSFSKAGVFRGLHLQKSPYAQAKLVKVIKGRVLDIAVDVRPGSKTFGEYVTIELNEEKQNQFFIPEGFLHGFITLEDSIFTYKCSNYYNKESEVCVNPLSLGLRLDMTDVLISDKDKCGFDFNEFIRKIK